MLTLPSIFVVIHQVRYLRRWAPKESRKRVLETVFNEKRVSELCLLLRSFYTVEKQMFLSRVPLILNCVTIHENRGVVLASVVLKTLCSTWKVQLEPGNEFLQRFVLGNFQPDTNCHTEVSVSSLPTVCVWQAETTALFRPLAYKSVSLWNSLHDTVRTRLSVLVGVATNTFPELERGTKQNASVRTVGFRRSCLSAFPGWPRDRFFRMTIHGARMLQQLLFFTGVETSDKKTELGNVFFVKNWL